MSPICTEHTMRDQGFTLLEVVVALAIAGLALVGLFRAASGGLFAVDTAARAEEAVQRAQSHLSAVGRDAGLVEGETTEDDGGGYRWTLRVSPLTSRQSVAQDGVSSVTITLFNVEVAISWPGHEGDRSVVLRTLHLGTAGRAGEPAGEQAPLHPARRVHSGRNARRRDRARLPDNRPDTGRTHRADTKSL